MTQGIGNVVRLSKGYLQLFKDINSKHFLICFKGFYILLNIQGFDFITASLFLGILKLTGFYRGKEVEIGSAGFFCIVEIFFC